MPTPVVVVLVIAVIALFIYQRVRLQHGLAQNQDKTFGAVADRLGMRVELPARIAVPSAPTKTLGQ